MPAFYRGDTRDTCLELNVVRSLLVLAVEEVRRAWAELGRDGRFAFWAIEPTTGATNTTTTTRVVVVIVLVLRNSQMGIIMSIELVV